MRRGQVESLEAALFLCDLRGFTELSIAAMRSWFLCVTQLLCLATKNAYPVAIQYFVGQETLSP
ncbi:hypothetical protein FHS20_004137 [Phyllobacterium endophyticum]|nr:hypothetical protein [Phyllobacterium endophyticum]